MQTLDLEEVSKLLKISAATGRNRLFLGLPMPPSFRVGRRRLFLATEVERWLLDKAERQQAAATKPMPRRGRPRKGSNR